MAAYAALVSLSHILHQILHPPPAHYFIIPRIQIESLQKIVCFLIDFLETYSGSRRSSQIEDLEKRIAEAAYAAEDILESEVVDQIRAKFESNPVKKRCALFYRNIERAVKEFLPGQGIKEVEKKLASIQKEVEEIKSRERIEDVTPGRSTEGSSSRSLPSGNNIMVGFDEHLAEIRRVLATDVSDRQIVPIVGMGGIGKTTLAANLYKDPFIVEHFQIRAWVTVSQEYTVREIALALLHQIDSKIDQKEQQPSVGELGNMLYKELFGRRYLIILDDMWDIQAWYSLQRFLPDTSNRSRVLVTTRQLSLAVDFRSSSPYEIGLLDEEKSWDLLRKKVFPKEVGSSDLERSGKNIARNCGGLPLALVVIGGLLAKSDKTTEFWEYVEKDVTFAANSEGDEHCRKILSLSYTHLPVCLKPCFLYLAMFPKNFEIHVPRLIRLWVAEGFIKQASSRSLEEDAREYLEDLLDRNLIVVGKRGCSGKVKTINIHDLIRDLCRIEAHKDTFLCIAKLDNRKITPDVRSQRRLSVHLGTRREDVNKVLSASTHSRSFLSYSYWEWKSSRRIIARRQNLLRVLDVVVYCPMDEILRLINSRCITCSTSRSLHHVSSSIKLLWNLQTIVAPGLISLPPEIWQMPQLRHLKMTRITLPDPPETQVDIDIQDIKVLQNLQTLSTVEDFIFKEHVLRRIPNLKKLGIYCRTTEEIESFCLSNIVSLHKLESLALAFNGNWKEITFPVSLKKLTLSLCQIPWEDMTMVGSLPNLKVLKLQSHAAKGGIWKPNEGEFGRLEFLSIDSCQLDIWEAEASHFPILKQVHLENLELEEIPKDFAGIPTLQMVNLKYCSSSLFISLKEMSREREDLGYEDIEVRSFPSQTRIGIQDNVVGLDDDSEILIKNLIEESEELEIISIIGMPGLGKTTLARKFYDDKTIQNEFPVLIWVSVSEDFNLRGVFLTIMKKLSVLPFYHYDDHELADKVRSYLEKPRFLLVVDDLWTVDHWYKIEAALPKSNKLGKVLITSRFKEIGWAASRIREPHNLRFLSFSESWEILQLQVFGKLDECPSDLVMFGTQIAEHCRGLPLAIVVVGGILAKNISSSNAKDEWENILSSLSMYHDCGVMELMENIILMSYNRLPQDLRDCFLYLGMFPDNFEIRAWRLIRLWIAEGFIKQKPDSSLEEVAEDNLKDLINMNLVLADKTTAKGGVKTCYVHDMIRKFFKSQAVGKQNFFQEVKKLSNGPFHPSITEIPNARRLCIHSHVSEFLQTKPNVSWVQSFLCFSKGTILLPSGDNQSILVGFDSLRVLDVNHVYFVTFPTKLTQMIHLSFIALCGDIRYLPEVVSDLWNLQTIIIDDTNWRDKLEIRANIWKMMKLRHLKTKSGIYLSNLGQGEAGENLQTLSRLSTECCTEDVFNRVSNLKNLGIRGNLGGLLDLKGLEKLDRLQKLKLVHDALPSENQLGRLPEPNRFPPNIKILTISSASLDGYHMATLGMIRTLEVLKLKRSDFKERVWEAGAGSFPSLEFLQIEAIGFELWTAADDSFPKIKSLVLKTCLNLQKIPPVLEKRLQVLNIERVTTNLVTSAKRMKWERQQMKDPERSKRGEFKLVIAPRDVID